MKKSAVLLIILALSLSNYCVAKKHKSKQKEAHHSDIQADDTSWHTTSRGLMYRIAKYAHKNTVKAEVGSQVTMNIHIYCKDSLLFDSRKMNKDQPVPMQVMPPMFNGDLAEGLTYMTAGDSAVFMTMVDSIAKSGQKLLPFMHMGDTLVYRIAMVTVKPAAEVKKEQAAEKLLAARNASRQTMIDDSLLKDYFARNNITPLKTASGLFYTIEKEGTGPKPKAGQTVSVNYTGKTLNGNVFDSNVAETSSHKEPLRFMIGRHQVIRGWDEGIGLLNKGAKATLYIPSTMAYGAQSPSPQIPPNSILIFDVELLDIQ